MSKFQPVFVRSANNYDTKEASDASGLVCLDESLAQQQFKDDNNPNLIMEKFARTGDVSLLQTATSGQYGDFTSATDFRTALHRVEEAKHFFSQLSASTRQRFDNDPAKFLEFFTDPNNRDEAVKLGFLKEGLSPAGGAASKGEAQPAGGNPAAPSKTSKKAVSGAAQGDSGDD